MEDIRKQIEEEAREYAEITPDVKNVNNLPETFGLNKIKYQTYLDVYHSRDEEVKELREALSALLILSEFLIDDLDAWDIEYPEIDKAKQLLQR